MLLRCADILDEFQSSEGELNPGAQGASGDAGLGSLDDDFARQLQVGMQDLLGEMQDSVCLSLARKVICLS